MKVRVVILFTILCVALAAASAAHAEALTLSISGTPGPWLGSEAFGEVYCEAPDAWSTTSNRWFQVQKAKIGRSSLASGRSQDIYMQVGLEWSADGARWYRYQTRPWQKRTVPPGFSSSYAVFGQETFDASAYGGFYWRSRVEFRWYIAGTSTWLGTAIDAFTVGGILRQYGATRYILNSTGEGVCYLP